MIIKNEILFESTVLSDNPLHDPYKRKIVLIGPKQKEGRLIGPKQKEGRPILIFFSGYGNSSLSMLNYDPFGGDMEIRIKTLLKKLFTGLYPTYTFVPTYCGFVFERESNPCCRD